MLKMAEMAMNYVEPVLLLAHFIQHCQMGGDGGPSRVWVKAQRRGALRYQIGGGDGVPAREQRDLMTSSDKLLGEERYDPFRSPVEARRDRFV
ncbi:hypothetical protein GCM10010869_50230 [Mesorhizobium tianshanense]|nr:hypothetical protein GCM10010869_50230 [Mesorhizobium tianshanense]